jgi:hypothetical protein
MPSARRFPPPWIVDEHNNACFIVRDATGQALGYLRFKDEPGRRSADVRFKATAVIGCFSSETTRSRMTQLRHQPTAQSPVPELNSAPSGVLV